MIFGLISAVNISEAVKLRKIQSKQPTFFYADVIKSAPVKAGPCAVSIIKGKIKENSKIKIVAKNGRWCKIIYNNNNTIKSGYIKESLTENSESAVIPAESLEINKPDFVCEAGESMDIPIQLSPVYSNETVEWESSDNAVVSVENGKITALKTGKATVTAKVKAQEKKVNITVVSYDDEFQFSQSSFEISVGESKNMMNELKSEKEKIELSSSDNNIISVKNGIIKAKSAGTALITAKKGGASASCRIYVINANKNASSPLKIINSYGNIYNYHPSVQYFENGWNGYKYWIAYTPYEKNNDLYENPHIAASNDLKNWEEPKGFKNPLEPVPPNYEHGEVYNSDTELVYNSDTGKLECWWRFFNRPSNNHVILRRKTTSDWVHWSETEDMLVADMNSYGFLSPAIIYENGKYRMWAVNENSNYSVDYRESSDGKNWSDIRQINIKYDDKKLASWHLGVIHTAKGYEMSVSAYYPGTNDRLHMNLYYAYSADNINYSKARLLFSPSRNTDNWDNQGLYRSSLLYDGKKYYLFYSGLNTKRGPSGLGVISGQNPFNMN
ncbi:MAG: Ig-like domain-containing protein [Clostridiales bacterium]|nr:Ig-like domain-containing protein [Clostridiales bacterium]